jgi:hypothetical protein
LLFSSVNALAVLSIALPSGLLADAFPAVPNAIPSGMVAQGEIPGFAEESSAMGLTAAGQVLVEDRGATAGGARLQVATTSAAASPFEDGIFFRRLSSQQIDSPADGTLVVAESETQVGHVDGHVWIDFIERFPEEIDEAADRYTGLAGVEIRKRIELEVTGFDLFVEALTGGEVAADDPAKVAIWNDLVESGQVTHGDLTQTVFVTFADGSMKSIPADRFQLADVLGEVGAGAGEESCVISCFGDVGVTVTFLGAICLVAGAAICAAACAVTAGVACIPCISGASLACGLGAATGSLGYCLAKCLFGVDPPPTPTRTRTPTRRPTATPNLAVVYTLDPPQGSVNPGSELSVGWTASMAHASNDWLGIFVPGAANTDYLSYEYLTGELSGTAALTAPDTPGTYELRILLANGYLEPSQPARAPLPVIIAEPGDCNGDDRISINELVLGVSIALGRRSLDDCIPFDGNGDGTVRIAELIRAVAAALR